MDRTMYRPAAPLRYVLALDLVFMAFILNIPRLAPSAAKANVWEQRVTCGGYSREYTPDERVSIVRRNVQYGIDLDPWLRDRVTGTRVEQDGSVIKYAITFREPVTRAEAGSHMAYAVDAIACQERLHPL